ncbi:uncharacterized protein LOC143353887 [Halictus rubicundus]|uniref:uncharacterized protein LOC143353887 n=1 Tax=Halictus rubicundus TaxID=77578 RepID=UPI0040358040
MRTGRTRNVMARIKTTRSARNYDRILDDTSEPCGWPAAREFYRCARCRFVSVTTTDISVAAQRFINIGLNHCFPSSSYSRRSIGAASHSNCSSPRLMQRTTWNTVSMIPGIDCEKHSVEPGESS